MADGRQNLRRSSRLKPAVKYSDEGGGEGKRARRRTRNLSNGSSDREQMPDELTRELENELGKIEIDTKKPTELYTEEQDVSGATIYKFPTPSKSGAMAQKAALSRLPSTPKRGTKQKDDIKAAQTPNAIREKTKRALAAIGRNDIWHGIPSESESESISEDEYVPSADEESNEVDSSSEYENSKEEGSSPDSSESDDEVCQKETARNTVPKAVPSQTTSNSRTKRVSRVTYNDYHLKTDEYFETQSEKVVTSDRTLGRLTNPRLDEGKLQSLLANQSHVSREHKEAIGMLSHDYRSLFPMWHYVMEEGYSLLLHGLGSKRLLMNDFRKEMLSDHPTLVVNGFFPSLTLKEILDGIIVDLLGLDSPSNPNEGLNLIEKILRENPEDRLYLLIHNIDGLMLRSNKIQDTLSLLANIPNLSLIASIDHINTPLIWDNIKHSRYNFCWWDVTTLLPYDAETSFESSILVQRSGALVLSSLVNVFLSLTKNAREIYVLLIKHQLENEKNNAYTGMAFKDLYYGARETFLVSSELVLRAQLTEFIDHKLVRSKRNLDGTEYLVIPLDNSLLKQFIEQQDNVP